MTYVSPNFKTKKSLKEAIAAGKPFWQPPPDGTVYLEGPHYPQPHTWFAVGTMKDGKLVKVK